MLAVRSPVACSIASSGEWPVGHVVLEALLRERLVRIGPGDDEDGVPLVDGVLDEAVLRLQVQDVELVDPGRHDQERAFVDLLGCRRILDELHQLVLVDHLAGRGRDVLADLEGGLVGHADLQAAITPLPDHRANDARPSRRLWPPVFFGLFHDQRDLQRRRLDG